MMKKLLLEAAQFTWLLYNQIIFIIICIYYHILSLIEQSTSCDHIGNSATSNSSQQQQSQVADLRIPNHIALCFTNELDYLDIESISRIICWCKQLNISYITIYDEVGRLKCKQKDIIKLFERQMRQPGCEGLNIISRSDGRPKFIRDVKEILLQCKSPDDVNLERVNKQVGWLSDPELLITFGSPQCLYGFPPWPLRLTEIFTIPTHRGLPRKIFVDCLKRFSKTSQRVGA